VLRDTGADRSAQVPSFVSEEEAVTGLAYDPYTDHVFLRLAPGNVIRVVDRPARAIKREFTIPLAPVGGGDLAVRPRDGHLYLLHPGRPAVVETTRLGKLLRTFDLAGVSEPPLGIAFDPARNRLLVLGADGRTVTFHDTSGAQLAGGVRLERTVAASLGFDGEKREYYAPLQEGCGGVGVFAGSGQLLRTLPEDAAFVDVGPRSFIRVF
jgi:hypothetical protein